MTFSANTTVCFLMKHFFYALKFPTYCITCNIAGVLTDHIFTLECNNISVNIGSYDDDIVSTNQTI